MKDKILIFLGDFITKHRYIFFGLFLLLFIIGIININNVKVNESLTDYLPSNTETKTGLKIMEEEFGTLTSIDIMLDEINEEEALSYYEKLKNINNIDIVLFELNESYYKDNKAIYKVELINKSKEETNKIAKEIKNITKEKDTYIYSDKFEDPTEGVTLVLILSIAIILVVLLLTAKTYFEPCIAFIIFLISIVLNMGSNFLLGEISYITKAIAVVLQLALSIDYVIIFMNQYMKEIEETSDKLLAIRKTISKSISEIFASALTTIAGLIALIFMQLKIGGDIGIVLSKGILCSFLTVILVMPFLLDKFKKQILKYKKKEKKQVNSILNKLSDFIVKYKTVMLPIYIILILVSMFIIPKYNYVYNINSISSINKSENIKNLEKQEEVFGKDNNIVVLLKNKEKDFEKEKKLATEIKKIKGVGQVTTLATASLGNNISIDSKLNYNQVAEMFNVKKEQALQLYEFLTLGKEIDASKYEASIFELLSFIYQNRSLLPIDNNIKETIENYYQSMSFLESKNYSRVILSINADIESNEALDIVEEIRLKAKEYYEEPLFIGNTINARDLKSTFSNDNLIITLITILFIAIILMFTFKSFGMTLLLILTIEGSILVNFAIITILGYKIFFMSYIVVCAIQMGATIDYAIVIADRYMQLRKKKDRKQAIVGTLHDRLLAIITSGLILLSAGFLVGTITTSSVISSIGLLLGLGTLISLLATMLFLPAILYTFDKFIEKTTIKSK